MARKPNNFRFYSMVFLVLGVVGWGLAFAHGFVYQAQLETTRVAVKKTVDQIVSQQNTRHASQNTYVLFRANRMDTGLAELQVPVPTDDRFTYEVVKEGGGNVMVVARVTAAAMKTLPFPLPPMEYRHSLTERKRIGWSKSSSPAPKPFLGIL